MIFTPYRIACIFFAILILLCAGLYRHQILHYAPIRTSLDDTSISRRGTIYFQDKNGNKIAAATSAYTYNVVVSPAEVGDPGETLESLKTVVPVHEKDFYDAVNDKKSLYKVIAKDVNAETIQKLTTLIKQYNLKGVTIRREGKRMYPLGSIGAQLLGFVSQDPVSGAFKGEYGLEKQYNAILENDRMYSGTQKEIFMRTLHVIPKGESIGGSLVTHIDVEVQKKLEDVLRKTYTKLQAKQVGGIVMDPIHGDIIAMANIPSFDPNKYGEEKDFSVYKNAGVEDVHELGSVMKTITLASGLQKNAINSHTTYDDKGYLKIDGYTIYNFDRKGRGPGTTMQEVINQSLNTGAVYMLLSIGIDSYRNFMRGFRFDSLTNIDLPNEASNLVSLLDRNVNIEYATASYGHGIAITPISAIRAFAAFANGGYIINPHVGYQIAQYDGTIKNLFPEQSFSDDTRILNKGTVKNIAEILVQAYETSALGQQHKNPHYGIATKTGTAEIFDKVAKKYDPKNVFDTFFGYFPASKPKYIVFLYVDQPQGAALASKVFGDPFSELVNFMIAYFQIPPDR